MDFFARNDYFLLDNYWLIYFLFPFAHILMSLHAQKRSLFASKSMWSDKKNCQILILFNHWLNIYYTQFFHDNLKHCQIKQKFLDDTNRDNWAQKSHLLWNHCGIWLESDLKCCRLIPKQYCHWTVQSVVSFGLVHPYRGETGKAVGRENEIDVLGKFHTKFN